VFHDVRRHRSATSAAVHRTRQVRACDGTAESASSVVDSHHLIRRASSPTMSASTRVSI
jgi:hypothetical protein